MELKSLFATFGRLKDDKLVLSPGLNVIEAANESGKTTWMAFLRVMLYGLNTRDRGPLADKHRYLPWDGGSMQGRIDLVHNGRSITVTRTTSRPTSPLGNFSACYTNTSTPVSDLESYSLGESLLGVPQEVFERSAFIRQSGVSINHSSVLEQRIAALITTGEEDTSYTDASEHLRKQLTRRRYHKTGLLPQLESEISVLESTLSDISAEENTLHSLKMELDDLSREEDYLRRQLILCDAARVAQQIARLNAAHDALDAAKAARDAAAARVAGLPSRKDLTAVANALSAVQSIDHSIQASRARMQEQASALNRAEQQLAAHPFAPQSPDEILASPITDIPRPRLPIWLCAFILTTAASTVPILYLLLHLPLAPSSGIALLLAGVALLCAGAITVRRQKAWDDDTDEKLSIRQKAVAAYTILYNEAKQENAAFRAASEAYRTIAADQKSQFDRIFEFIRLFSSAETPAEAHRAIEKALSFHTAFDNAEQHYRQEKLHFELLAENIPNENDLPTEPPKLTREEAEGLLEPLVARLADLQRTIHTTQGRIAALGDPQILQAELNEKRTRHNILTKEYEALSLACDVLSDANAVLQTRFSPALGEKSANIFTKLTKGKYNKVLLDRTLTPSIRSTGEVPTHSVSVLSQGTADQLYLAVRLAICDTVLPEEKCVPIFLDDALVTFDDERMTAALDYLVELSERRQILLFTCQQRELNYLRSAHPHRYHPIKLSSLSNLSKGDQ